MASVPVSPTGLPLGLALAAFALSLAAAVWPPLRPMAVWLMPACLAAVVGLLWRLRVHAREDAARPPREGRSEPVRDAQAHRQGQALGLRPGEAPPAPSATPLETEAFLYSISHDLRAPLRVVLGFARMVQEDHAAALGSDGREHLARIEHAAERMSSMIDALLSLSRLSSRPLACVPIDLSTMAQGVIDELQRLAPERRVEVHIEPGLRAQGDATLLQLVLENLLGNAWKYSAKRDLARIEVGTTAMPDGSPRFHVRDNGAGFDMRYADKLFAPFQRLHSASEFEGTGVGLASARRIVERHGGRLWAEAQVDQGASFYFTLP